MPKRTYFKVTFTALIEEPTEDEAREAALRAVEYIDEYVGSGSSADPLIYKTELASVEPYTGPDPFAEDEDEAAERAAAVERALIALVSAVTAPDAFPIELAEGAEPPKLLPNPRLVAALQEARDLLGLRPPLDPATVRVFLDGLVKRPCL